MSAPTLNIVDGRIIATLTVQDNAAAAATAAANSAENSATSATASANTATTQAGIATTKASEASTSATESETQAGIATTQAGIATTKAGEAESSATEAETYASNALTSENNAAGSETSAGTSATNSANSAILSQAWAESPTEPGGVGTKSSLTSANEAKAARDEIVGKINTVAPATLGNILLGDGIKYEPVTLDSLIVTENTNLYFTELRVRNSVLTGYSIGSNTALSATDSIIGAFGKIQGQINARVSGTISSGQVAFGSEVNTIAGDSGFFWDNSQKGLSIGGTLPSNTKFYLENDSTAQQANAARFRGTGSSVAKWKGRLVAGGDTVAFLMGEYDNKAYLGAHNAALNSWSDFYLNPEGNFNLFLGRVNLMVLSNSSSRIGIKTDAPTETLDVNGTTRIRSISNATGNFLTTSATGVIQQRTALESSNDILKSISGYNASVAQRLEHTVAGVINWVNI